MDIHYTRQKLFGAVYALATSPATIQLRLAYAFQGIIASRLSEKSFPDDLVDDWSLIHQSLTSAGPILDKAGRLFVGSIENTIRQFSDEQCSDICAKIVELYASLVRKEAAL
ncbi:MAG: hypothetical protein WCW62_10345 [Bacteroidales bacterium]|jgi:hypothetical protein